ncbi:hypothetical protein BDV95DRAFT_500684 [Massariosphaeria phaeospora]|uniref:Uncharacterized protein n=1 Tax=Massariosphaeria phaeospora TaxID=100035 RepID=A0A7C8M4T3_9PLEO|nr:hypothetical protein BDV95DRAFT_500684 [Massariosphaeria phaeospora]
MNPGDAVNGTTPEAMEQFAIIGLSFVLPQEAVDETRLWDVLENGKNLMTEWPKSRAAVDSFYDGVSQLHGRGGHFIKEDPAVFDAPFFSIPVKEAIAMDPQQRWALEAAYHALENAGVPLESIRGSRTAVYASSFSDDYARMLAKDPDTAPQHTGIGTASSIVPNRISWQFNLRGPSVHVDTACSSGLVALDLACQSMRSGDATAALVIGSSALLSPELTTLLANMRFLSPDSRCFSFDARANGFARGEGVVALVVRPLDDALARGDVIRAVIRASASNQDGRTPTLTQPSVAAQEALIRHVYAKAGLGLDATRYFEAHGTGTAVGDPIEINAIGRVFRPFRSPEEPLYVQVPLGGSIKANIGHLEAASGLAAIVKCILVLEKGVIPQNALFEKLNPDIDADFFNVQVPTKSIPWPSRGLRRVSVSSFGFGGTNSHVVLDDALHYLRSRKQTGYHNGIDAPAESNGTSSSTNELTEPSPGKGTLPRPRLLIWSAADAAALVRMGESYQGYYRERIAENPDELDKLSYTLAKRRTIMPWRTFAVVDTAHENANGDGDKPPPLSTKKPVRASTDKLAVAFVFTGQGAQYAEMGLELLQYSVFEESLRQSDKIFRSLGCRWSVFDMIRSNDKIHSPEISQPLCTALQLALVELLRTFAVTPAAVIGHSSGEIAAAYTIGALSHSSACKVAYYRGQVAEKLCRSPLSMPGAMMSVNMAETQVSDHLEGLENSSRINVACVNSPTNVTLAGPLASIDSLKSRLDKLGIFAQKVNTGVAYHSPAMQAVAADYLQLMGSLQNGCASVQQIPMVSSVTGRIVAPKTLATPQYWLDNLLSPVRFADALQRLQDGPPTLPLPLGTGAITDLIEIGPHGALRRPVRDTVPALIYHTILERTKSPLRTTLELLGTLFARGHSVSVLAGNLQAYDTLPFLIDCPSYPFDHTRQYWTESRISRDYRLRPRSPGYLLGRQAHDWNPLQPRWRNWQCTEAIPWLADHVVNDTIVCPGTGMLVMALEAATQAAAGKEQPISGVLIKDARFIAPIIVRDSLQDSTETVVELRPIQNVYEKVSDWSKVRIFTQSDGNWKLCFSADIQLQYEETIKSQLRWADENPREQTRIREKVDRAALSCTRPIDQRSFYGFCEENGIRYGPTFQLLSDIGWDGHRTSNAAIDMVSARQLHKDANSPVHPAVLDAALQLLMVHASRGLTQTIPTSVPQRIADTWISAKAWSQTTSSVRLCSFTQADVGASKSLKGSVYAVDDNGSPLCTIKHIVTAEVSLSNHPRDDGRNPGLLYKIAWKPQLSSMTAVTLQQLCKIDTPTSNEEAMKKIYPKIELAMRVSARKALKGFKYEDLEKASGYLKKYVASLKRQFGVQPCNESEDLSDSALEHLLQECETEQPDWRMFPAIARALPSILRNETNPLELLFSSKAAEDFYVRSFGSVARDERLRTFLNLVTHETPSLRILEVGAGTGSMTRSILNTLQAFEQETGQTRFAEYTYTDISPSFFEEARNKFGEFRDRMTFKTFDLESEISKQGFKESSYDMILAGSVLHVTSDLEATLKKIHKLLKPSGHLVFLEITTLDSACANVGFGSLEGWWAASEEWRRYSPLVTEQRWDELLRESGFSGVDLSLRDFESDICHLTSVMISTSLGMLGKNTEPGVVSEHSEQEIVLIIDPNSDTQRGLAAQISKRHACTRVIQLDDGNELEHLSQSSCVCVSLLEVGVPRLATLCETDFHSLRSYIQSAQHMLWVTSSAGSDGAANAYYSVATGFFRSLRSEQDSKHLVTLAIETCATGSEADFVSQVLRTCFLNENTSTELEFVVRDGYLAIGRLAEEVELDTERLSRVRPKITSQAWNAGPPLALDVGTLGMLDTLQFVEDDACDLSPNEVEIEAAVWPISFRDVFIALGRLGKEGMGFECAGTVSRVGSACTTKFRPGERVLMIVPGCMRSHPRSPADAVFKLSDSMSFEDAVAGMNPGMTAWYALVHVARLQRGEKVLIHAAAGSTGQMAVKIAKMLGAEIFVTVGSEEKRQLVMDPDGLDIPESHVFYSRNTSFAQGIMRATDDYGVDVVLNSLSGRGLRATWECIAPYGRFVDIGKSDIMANSSLPMGGFARNVSFASADLSYIVVTNSELTRQLVEKVLSLADTKVGGPAPLHIFPVSAVEKAFRYMQSGKNTGRILVTLSPGDVVLKNLTHKSTWHFDANASYLIAGGLGGVGRAIIRWMAERGAKNIIIPSRSGPSSQAASDLVSELTSKGLKLVVPRCDVSCAAELEALLQACKGMPPIKGCMNLAMVLQDAVFDNMTHAQWTQTIQSKVQSSWNMHRLLPKQMDFFILVSSLSGIYGLPSQSNYAAGNTFLDALARTRATAGGFGTSVSLDLGWMQDVGIVAERADYRRLRENVRDMIPIRTEDLLAVLEHYCDPSLPAPGPEQSQLLIGVKTPDDSRVCGEVPLPYIRRPLFAPFDVIRPHAATLAGRAGGGGVAPEDAAQLFAQASGATERTEVVVDVLKKKLSHALGIQVEDIDARRNLSDYGVDSLMGVELRNLMWQDFNVSVAVFEIMGGGDIRSLAQLVAKKAE